MNITIKTQVLGKERELLGDVRENCWYLNQVEDVIETGIYCGNTLEQWNSGSYLERINGKEMEI